MYQTYIFSKGFANLDLILIHSGTEKFKISTPVSDLHLYIMDGAEICASEDLIDEIINGKMLMLAETFDEHKCLDPDSECISIDNTLYSILLLKKTKCYMYKLP